jgi:hypothetical protein
MYQQTITTSGSTAVFNTYSKPQPTAHITKGRGRLKTYGQSVYLKDGSTFEIELHNPKQTTVLAKIWINGQLLSDAGLILRPGQRVYLERFMDDAKKFMFQTYEVDNSPETKAAIAANGKVEVHFYDEVTYHANTSAGTFNSPWIGGQSWTYFDSGLSTLTGAGFGVTTTNCAGSFYNGVSNTSNVNYCAEAGPIETGRVEKGESSNQAFATAYGNFNSWTCGIVNWQILPESKKPVEIGEIRSYCTGCGTRHKKSSWKFCPNCGTPISE